MINPSKQFFVVAGILIVEMFLGHRIYLHKDTPMERHCQFHADKEEGWSLMITFGVVPRQFDRLVENIDLWKDLPPCDHAVRSNHHFELSLVIHTTWEEHAGNRTMFQQIFDNNPHLNRCFNQISFVSANTHEEEKKEHWQRAWPSAKGPNALFLSGIDAARKSNCTYMMWMEADAFPVKKHWLDHLISTTTRIPTFMIRGSPPIVESNPIMMDEYPNWSNSYRLHINGCALYAITRTTLAFVNESFAFRGMTHPWDVMLYEELYSPFLYASHQKLMPMYQHSYFIQNRYSDTTPISQIVKDHPDTIFLHHPWCFPDQGQCPEPKLQKPPSLRDILGLPTSN
eukprot:TRINITY_DN921_c0_g1_i1.p1 TRINITY_DN921_c0_g1~~TRINITY_DN921_c0_g1_i1.p1  ORF type:complete len:342 (-),score=43.14 TRINITY_DN921_c0_g1_i1:107-1132(-)